MKKPTVILSLLLDGDVGHPWPGPGCFRSAPQGRCPGRQGHDREVAAARRRPRRGRADAAPLRRDRRERRLVDFLVDKGAKLEPRIAKPKTPLHLAAMNDRTEAAGGAASKGGPPIEARDDYQRTALILCARERGQAATGRVLIEAGADVNAVDKFGDRPRARGLAGQGGVRRPAPREGRPRCRTPAKWRQMSRKPLPRADQALSAPDRGGPDLKALGRYGEPPPCRRGRRFRRDRRRSSSTRDAIRPGRPLRLDAAPLRRPGRPDRGRPDPDRTGAPSTPGRSWARRPTTSPGSGRWTPWRRCWPKRAPTPRASAFPVLEGDYLGQNRHRSRPSCSAWASSRRSGASTARRCFPRTGTKSIGRR